MSDKERKFYIIAVMGLAAALVLSIGFGLWEHGTVKRLREKVTMAETIKVKDIRIDTIRDTIPKLVSETKVGVIKVPVRDILSGLEYAYSTEKVDIKQNEGENPAYNIQPTITDTITLPRTQRKYQDSTYTAWVSGYEPKLDSINVYRKTITETVTIRIPADKKRTFWQRFSLGIQAGYGIGLDDKKAHPYVGAGVGFEL